MKTLRNIRKKISIAVRNPKTILDQTSNEYAYEYVMQKRIKLYV
ncbi:hypothetical protein [Aquimarina spongiae]|uniref:Uncharacterized protein n=1 Tax=Aquimarina spongiae TaxID=570521 RepID=A0A1M6AWZ7_9FLAO|nr:hypothetical protein [Aquimarina spongiae]SHI40970.1 hypothetical protein SAMN04488508_101519 [Aquimarina spongiae]